MHREQYKSDCQNPPVSRYREWNELISPMRNDWYDTRTYQRLIVTILSCCSLYSAALFSRSLTFYCSHVSWTFAHPDGELDETLCRARYFPRWWSSHARHETNVRNVRDDRTIASLSTLLTWVTHDSRRKIQVPRGRFHVLTFIYAHMHQWLESRSRELKMFSWSKNLLERRKQKLKERSIYFPNLLRNASRWLDDSLAMLDTLHSICSRK